MPPTLRVGRCHHSCVPALGYDRERDEVVVGIAGIGGRWSNGTRLQRHPSSRTKLSARDPESGGDLGHAHPGAVQPADFSPRPTRRAGQLHPYWGADVVEPIPHSLRHRGIPLGQTSGIYVSRSRSYYQPISKRRSRWEQLRWEALRRSCCVPPQCKPIR